MTAPAIQTSPACPKCGSQMYDNRQDNAKRVAEGKRSGPDFKCKQYKSGCEGVIWPPRGGAASFAPRQGMQTPLPNTKQPHSIGLTGNALLDEQTASEDKTFAELQAGEEWITLKRRYLETLDFVTGPVLRKLTESDVGASPESLGAITAQIWIERNKRGV